MILELTDQEADYVFRVFMARPMGEVEILVNKMRAAAQAMQRGTAQMQKKAPADASEGAYSAPNGHGDGVDSLPLP